MILYILYNILGYKFRNFNELATIVLTFFFGILISVRFVFKSSIKFNPFYLHISAHFIFTFKKSQKVSNYLWRGKSANLNEAVLPNIQVEWKFDAILICQTLTTNYTLCHLITLCLPFSSPHFSACFSACCWWARFGSVWFGWVWSGAVSCCIMVNERR